jgi:hypothetical protein
MITGESESTNDDAMILTIVLRSSLAHGTPPLVHRQNYDVPVPGAIHTRNTAGADGGSESTFTHLCTLSQILGDLLSLVYSLQNDHDGTMRSIRRAECGIDEWERRLPVSLQQRQDPAIGSPNGTSNLHFCHLSVRLLLCRIAFKATLAESTTSVSEARSYRLAVLREAAFALTDFVTTLTPAQLSEFWLPYTAHLLVTATTILLRCLLESTDLGTKRLCAVKLVQLRSRLKTARQESDWDLADFCLERCSDPIGKISTALGVTDDSTSPSTSTTDAAPVPLQTEYTPIGGISGSIEEWPMDFLFPVDSLDYPFDALWDMPTMNPQ